MGDDHPNKEKKQIIVVGKETSNNLGKKQVQKLLENHLIKTTTKPYIPQLKCSP